MATDHEDSGGSRAGRPRRGDRGLFGMVLLFAGLVWFLTQAGLLHVAADTLLSILLMCIGAGLLITRRSGRRAWPVLLGGVVLFVLMGSSASARVHWGGPSGQDSFAPRSLAQLHPYQLRAGNMQLDLTHLAFTGTAQVSATVDAGDIQVTVPSGVGVRVRYENGVGDVSVEGQDLGHGFVTDGSWSSPGFDAARRRIVLDLQVRVGDINLTRSATPAPPPAADPASAPSGPPA